MAKRDILAVVFLLFCAALLGLFFSQVARSSDLLALWMAGVFLSEGQTDLIYFTQEPLFTMRVHDPWIAYLAQRFDYHGAVFPFVYPPLWAYLAQSLATFDMFALMRLAAWANALLLMGCVWLGTRIVGAAVPVAAQIGFALAALMMTQVGALAMFENQPQILVSFLILLGIERSRAGASMTAGAALALAAAIKLYPAAIALLWLASGNRRALATFCVLGTALAIGSVASTGWALHAAFLQQVAKVSASSLITPVNWNLHAMLGQTMAQGAIGFVDVTQFTSDATPGSLRGWWVLAKPDLWRHLTTLAPLLLAAFAWRSFRAPNPCHWGALLTALALTAPIGWAYYYIPTVVLVPALWPRLTQVGRAVSVAMFVLVSFPVVGLFRPIGVYDQGIQIVGTLAMCALTALFAVAARNRP